MRRRQFITLLGGAAAAWPPGAWAQQTAMPEIVFFNSGRPTAQVKNLAAFRQGLKEISFVEGQNVAIEFRWAENQFDRLPALAADVVARRPAVIVSNTLAALLWREHPRRFSPGRPLCRANSQGREGGPSAGGPIQQVRVRDQPQHRQGARAGIPPATARHRRRGDRVRTAP